MSDSWLKFVPQDPQAQPTREAAESGRRLLKAMLPAAEVSIEFLDAPQFIDAGELWEGVDCAKCGADAGAWWLDAVDRALDGLSCDLTATTPCCDAQVSLNEMKFATPVGFARFALEAMNPDVADITPAQLEQLQTCLGLPLRRIWARY